MPLQTEYNFVLPKGYLDDSGTLHRNGRMRLATAADEILPLKDPRVQSNPSYLSVILLSRVISKLEGLEDVNPRIIEGLFVEDLAYLQELYRRINGSDELTIKSKCQHCGEQVEVSMTQGESEATPSNGSMRR
ncbi:MAG: phage tail assembly protein [Deltaproteobacteria bacterium]|nr:phage tail assembly protein [Deltaproteobacteria bacterium]